uniref:Mitochondrial import receptor subunit TOM5 homolog n=1 Tax=Rhizophora mucronata TaxID=61149 RepID=A0A2P2JKG2_RHIMU
MLIDLLLYSKLFGRCSVLLTRGWIFVDCFYCTFVCIAQFPAHRHRAFNLMPSMALKVSAYAWGTLNPPNISPLRLSSKEVEKY